MTRSESKSVNKFKRSLLWLVLVVVATGFANWSEQRLDDNRAREIRVNQGPNAEKRIAGTQAPTSAALLMQLRFASAMLEPRGPQQRRGFSPFDDDPLDPARRDDSRDDQSFRPSNSRIDAFGSQRNSQSTNSFSWQSPASPYVMSPNSGFGRTSTFGQTSTYSYGESSAFGQSSSRTNSRNQSDASSGLLGFDNPN